MNKEGNEVQQEPTEKKSIKARRKKILFWSLLATGIGAIIIVVVLLLVFLLPKEEKFEIDLGSNVSLEEGTLNGSGSYSKGDSVTIVAEDISGYRFTGWSFNGNIISTEKEYTFVIGEDTEGEYTANYAKEYSIGIQSGNVTVAVDGGKSNAIAGEEVSFTVDAQGYQIRTVYLSCANDARIVLEAIEGKYTFTMPESDVEIVVESSKIYSVTLGEQSEYGEFNIEPMQATSGEIITVNFELKDEYIGIYSLKRLYYIMAGQVDQVTIENNTFTMPEGNVTIHAELNNLYNVNLTTNIEEDVVLTGEGTYVENDTVTITAPNVAGYRFRNWTYNNATVTTDQEYTITGIDSATSGTYIANYDRLYSITTNSTNGTVTITDNKTEAIANESVSFTVQPDADYRLIEVKVNNETLQAQDGKYTFAMPAENVTIDVTYSQLFDISVTSEHGTVSITDNKTEAIANEKVSFTITPEENYRIESVSINKGSVEYTQDENTYSFNMSAGNATISVTYSELFDIVVSSNHGTVTIGESKTEAIANESVSFTIKPSENYRIASVSINDGAVEYTTDESTYSFNMPAENVTISVTYDREYVITVDSNSSGYVQIEKQNAIAGESVEFTVSERTGYRITEVKYNDTTLQSESNTYSFNMPAENVTISVTYDREYAITVDSNSSGYVQIEKQNAIAGESVEFTVLDRTDYRLIEVKVNNETVVAEEGTYSFNMPAGDVTIAVTYSELFDIIVTSEHGTVTIGEDKTEAIENESVSFTIEPSENYRIESISINSGSVEYTQEGGTYSFTMPAGLVIIAVIYDREYAITVDSNSTEYVQIEKQNAIAGESVEFTVSERTGYRITEVKYNETTLQSESNTYSFNMPAGDVTISVTYAREYAITVDSNSSGYVQIEKQNAIAGESVEFTVLDRTDYRLIEVKVNNETVVAEEGTYSFNMPAGDVTIAVTYSELFDIIVTSEHGTVTIGEDKTEAIENESVSFTIEPSENYRIESISINSGSVEYTQEGGTYSFTMPAGLVIIAVTYDREYAITVDSNSSAYVQIDKQNAIAGESVEFTVSDRAGYRITEVKYNNTTLQTDSNTYSFNMPAEGVTISVTYAREYAVAIDLSASEKVTGVNVSTAINGEKIIVFANIQDSVEDNTVTLEGLYYIESGSENRVPINQTDGQYSFTMPANNVTIYAESQTYRRLDDFTFSGNSITDYTGSASQLTLPAYYDTVTVNSRGYTVEKDTGKQITSIGYNAFYDCTSLTSITIPEGVTSIGTYTFYNCTSLTSITIPEGVTSIGWYTFYGCSNLTSITLPNSLKSIKNSAFNGCSSLASITLPNSLKSIEKSAFNGCKSLTSITLPNSLTSIGEYAFQYCISLTSITIPEGVTSIVNHAFSSCTSLTSITIPEGVTSIGSRAFYDCYALAIVYNNSSLEIVAGTYGGVAQYAKEVVKNGEVAQGRIETAGNVQYYINSNKGDYIALAPSIGRGEITSITLIEGTTEINQYAFQSCSNLTSITIPEGVTSIGSSAFFGCYALAIVYNNSNLGISAGATTYGGVAQYAREVVETGGVAKGGFETIGNVMYYINNTTNEKVALYVVDKDVTSVTLAEDTTEIQGWAFRSCTSLTSITIPEGVTSIGEYAFSSCRSLTSITIPKGVTSIGNYAFSGCYALAIVYNNSSLEISAGETTYGGVAQYAQEVVKNGGVAQGRFEVTNNVNYYINDVTNEKVAIYVVDKDVTSVTLAEDTTEIQAGAFSDCTSLTSITIPEGVTSIGLYAFEYCSSLTSITLPNSLTSIGSGVFRDCTRLYSITIPEGVTSIGNSAFWGCTSLTEITIKSGDIYSAAVGTGYNHAGYLLQKATTVRVLTTIVNTYDNSYLENTSNFSTSKDGEYTVFTKV